MKEYIISELAKEWDTSITTVKKRIKQEGIETHLKEVNNREIAAVWISEDIFNKYCTKGISKGVVESIDTPFEGVIEHQKPFSAAPALADTLIELQREFNISLKDAYESQFKQLQNYADRIIDAEAKTRLIEDKTKTAKEDAEHWKNEYFKLKQQSDEQLKQIEQLKNRKWYQRK